MEKNQIIIICIKYRVSKKKKKTGETATSYRLKIHPEAIGTKTGFALAYIKKKNDNDPLLLISIEREQWAPKVFYDTIIYK